MFNRGEVMKNYIENTLHQSVKIEPFNETDKLPLSLKSDFDLYCLNINNLYFLLAEPKNDAGISELRKTQKRIQQLTGYYCVFYLHEINQYAISKMIEEGIPFIVENKQIYIPFIGIAISQSNKRVLKPCNQISFLTQKLLITAIYQQWEKVNITKAAALLNVTKTSVTRCFDEIEILSIPVLKKYGRSRYIIGASNKKEFWNKIKDYMRNPLIYSYSFNDDIKVDLPLSGLSALSKYSMLEDNSYHTYAVTKDRLKELQINKMQPTPKGETPVCIVHEVGYMVNYHDNNAVDPITVSLMMTTEEKSDPRIEIAIEEMLEEYVW